MKINRATHEKYKDKLWLINIGVDKYIWFKKPKHIIINIGELIFNLIKFPFFTVGFLITCILESIVETLEFSFDLVKHMWKGFMFIFPAYVQVTDKNELISESKLKIKDGKFINNINSDEI